MDASQAQSAAVPGDAAPGGTPPPAAAEAPIQATPEATGTPGGESPAVPVSAEKDKGSILVPHGAMKKLKEAERAAGAAALKADLDERAKNLGFRDMDALLEARVTPPAPKKKKAPPAAVVAAAAEIEDEDEEADDEEEVAPPPVKAKPAAAAEVPQITAATFAEEKKQRQRAERKARDLEMRLQSQQAQAHVERALILAGAKDLDYLYSRFQRETVNFTPEQAMAFEIGPWIEQRRKEQAHLFGDAIVPIDTTRGATTPAVAGKPEAAALKTQPPKEEEQDARGSGAAVAVDPKTGQYVMNKNEKDAMLQKIIRDAAGYKPPVMPQ